MLHDCLRLASYCNHVLAHVVDCGSIQQSQKGARQVVQTMFLLSLHLCVLVVDFGHLSHTCLSGR